MSIYITVFKCICMHACMYCMCIYVCACIYVYMHVCIYACMYNMYACVHTCMYICNFQAGFWAVPGGIVLVGRGNCPGGSVRGNCPGGKCPGPLVGIGRELGEEDDYRKYEFASLKECSIARVAWGRNHGGYRFGRFMEKLRLGRDKARGVLFNGR